MNNFNLKKLTILCDTRPHCLTNRSLEIVTSMKNLSYLSLLWTKKLKSDQIVDVIKNCPHL